MLELAIALKIVLTSSKVPHEVAPIHEVALVREEKVYILEKRRNLDTRRLTSTLYTHVLALDTSHPVFVGLGMTVRVHAREEHIVGIDIVRLVTNDAIAVGLVCAVLLHTLIFGSPLCAHRHVILTFYLHSYRSGIRLTIEQGSITILLAAQIVAEREDILRRVLIHRSIGRRAYYNHSV